MISRAYAAFDGVAEICQRYNPEEYPAIHRMIEDRRKSPSASIMVYGVYNAGKSTLINALLGEADRASVSDKPETDKINSYRWREYEIFDTPGIDAPPHHEAVTREQLYSANAVIFVVNPLGIVEEADTLDVLLELIKRKKQVFVVLNCKNPLEADDAGRIKDQLRTRIQKLAEGKSLKDVLTDIPILEVNAKTALRAKIDQKNTLLNHSGLPRLEAELNKFLASIDDKAIAAGFISELSSFLESTLTKIESQTQDSSISRINAFFEDIEGRQAKLRGVLRNLIEAKTSFIEKKAFSIISANPEHAQPGIESLVQTANTEIFNELEIELNRLAADSAKLLNTLQESISISNHTNTPEAPIISSVSIDTPNGLPISTSGIDPGKLQLGLQQLGTVVKPDHIVEALKVGKEIFPKLFEGIGPVAMGKIAQTILGKVLPAIGIVTTVWQIGQSLFGEDPEEARIREEAHQRELAEERRNEAIRDASEKLAWEFSTTITKAVNDNIQSHFAQVNNKLTAIRESFGAEQQAISQDRAQVTQALEILKNHA